MMPAAAALAINQVSLWNEYNKMVISDRRAVHAQIR